MNNYLKWKLYNLFVGKRCPACFKAFKKEKITVSLQVGFNFTQHFIIQKPNKTKTVLKTYNHFINEDDKICYRNGLSLIKVRERPQVMCLEVDCDCGCSQSFEIKVNAN